MFFCVFLLGNPTVFLRKSFLNPQQKRNDKKETPTKKKKMKQEVVVVQNLVYLKMSFIYSAILEGWSVKMLADNKLCFTKKNVKKHYSVETFLRKHMNQFKS